MSCAKSTVNSQQSPALSPGRQRLRNVDVNNYLQARVSMVSSII